MFGHFFVFIGGVTCRFTNFRPEYIYRRKGIPFICSVSEAVISGVCAFSSSLTIECLSHNAEKRALGLRLRTFVQ